MTAPQLPEARLRELAASRTVTPEKRAMAAELLAARETITGLTESLDSATDEVDEVASALGRWKPLRDSVGAAANEIVSDMAKVKAERDAARAEVERLQPKVCCGKFGEAIPECSNCVPKLRAEVERVAKQRDELVGLAMKLLEPIETMRVTRGSFGIGYDQVPDAICRLIGFAKSLVDAIAAEQPKPAGGA